MLSDKDKYSISIIPIFFFNLLPNSSLYYKYICLSLYLILKYILKLILINVFFIYTELNKRCPVGGLFGISPAPGAERKSPASNNSPSDTW